MWGAPTALYGPIACGCVEFTQRFFGDGELNQDAFDRYETAARLELGEITGRTKPMGGPIVMDHPEPLMRSNLSLRRMVKLTIASPKKAFIG